MSWWNPLLKMWPPLPLMLARADVLPAHPWLQRIQCHQGTRITFALIAAHTVLPRHQNDFCSDCSVYSATKAPKWLLLWLQRIQCHQGTKMTFAGARRGWWPAHSQLQRLRCHQGRDPAAHTHSGARGQGQRGSRAHALTRCACSAPGAHALTRCTCSAPGVHALTRCACSHQVYMLSPGVHALTSCACSHQVCMLSLGVHALTKCACSAPGARALTGCACSHQVCMLSPGVHALTRCACSHQVCMQFIISHKVALQSSPSSLFSFLPISLVEQLALLFTKEYTNVSVFLICAAQSTACRHDPHQPSPWRRHNCE